MVPKPRRGKVLVSTEVVGTAAECALFMPRPHWRSQPWKRSSIWSRISGPPISFPSKARYLRYLRLAGSTRGPFRGAGTKRETNRCAGSGTVGFAMERPRLCWFHPRQFGANGMFSLTQRILNSPLSNFSKRNDLNSTFECSAARGDLDTAPKPPGQAESACEPWSWQTTAEAYS